MSRVRALVVLALAAAAALGWWAAARRARSRPVEPPASLAPSYAAAARPPEDAAPRREDGRTGRVRSRAAEPTNVDRARVVTPDEPRSRAARGVVLDTAGQPVDGLDVALLPCGAAVGSYDAWRAAIAEARSLGETARTEPDGSFALRTTRGRGEVFATSERWATLFAAVWSARLADEGVTIVVAPAVTLAGHVLDDATSAPVSGATLATYDEFGPGLAGFPRPLPRAIRAELTWPSDARGAFRIEGLAMPAGRRIDVSGEGFSRTTARPRPVDTFDLEIRVTRHRPVGPGEVLLRSEPLLFGRVVTPGRAPVPGATVRLGARDARTDDTGAFEFERPDYVGEHDALVAWAPSGAVGWTRDPARWEGGGERLGPLELVVDTPLRVVTGRVVDDRGAPVPGVIVRLFDPTTVDTSPKDPVHVERGPAREPWPVSDADGRFRLRGLLPRAYTALAYDPATFASTSAGIAAEATEVTLTLPRGALVPALAGVVRDEHGLPVGGVEVTLSLTVERVTVVDATREETLDELVAVTRADGGFTVPHAPRGGAMLRFTSSVSAPHARSIESLVAAPSPALVTVRRRHLVRIDAAARDPRPTHVELRDAADLPVVFERAPPARGVAREEALIDGRSVLLAAPSDAATAVLLRNGAVVARAPLLPRTGDVTVIR